MRKHRLAECLLVDVIGLEWEQVHAEACRWEHVMSEAVERRLLELLGHPTESPYGNPIPGPGGAGREDAAAPVTAEAWSAAGPARAGEDARPRAVRRIGEPIQTTRADGCAGAGGARPGATVKVTELARRGAGGQRRRVRRARPGDGRARARLARLNRPARPRKRPSRCAVG